MMLLVQTFTIDPYKNKRAGPEAKDISPTTGLTLLWALNPFRGNYNYWQVSRKEAGKQQGTFGQITKQIHKLQRN